MERKGLRNIKDLIMEGDDEVLSTALRLTLTVSEAWNSLVGEKLSRYTRPYKVKGKKLYVSADSSVWAQELLFLREYLEKEVKEITDGEITEIKIKVKYKP